MHLHSTIWGQTDRIMIRKILERLGSGTSEQLEHMSVVNGTNSTCVIEHDVIITALFRRQSFPKICHFIDSTFHRQSQLRGTTTDDDLMFAVENIYF